MVLLTTGLLFAGACSGADSDASPIGSQPTIPLTSGDTAASVSATESTSEIATTLSVRWRVSLQTGPSGEVEFICPSVLETGAGGVCDAAIPVVTGFILDVGTSGYRASPSGGSIVDDRVIETTLELVDGQIGDAVVEKVTRAGPAPWLGLRNCAELARMQPPVTDSRILASAGEVFHESRGVNLVHLPWPAMWTEVCSSNDIEVGTLIEIVA
jgi:hypothetical protein